MLLKQKLTIEELVSLPLNTAPIPSYDGKKICFRNNNTGKMEYYLLDLSTMETRQLTHGEAPASSFHMHIWSGDGKNILYMKDPIEGNEKLNIFSFDIEKNKEFQLTDDSTSMDVAHEVSLDNNLVLFSSDRSKSTLNLFAMKLDGSEVKQLTFHSRPVSLYALPKISPDGKKVAYTANESNNLKNQDIWVINVDGTNDEKLISIKTGSKDAPCCWTKNLKKFIFESDEPGFNTIMIYDFESKSTKRLGSGSLGESFGCYIEKLNKIIVHREVGVYQQVISYDLDSGEEKSLDLPEGFLLVNRTVVQETKFVVTHSSPSQRTHHLLYDLENESYKEIIPAQNNKYVSERDFHKAQVITYPSTGKAKIEAILYSPTTENGQNVPAIIVPHGGPTAHYLYEYDEQAQILVESGYAVLYPNVRGSTGYGVEFRDACINDWGGKDLEDIESAVKYLLNLDFIDKNNIGITGISYGGYMTYLAMTKKPQYWKCGIAIAGITSIKRLYEKDKETFPALSFFLEEQMGIPNTKEVQDLWEERSAVNFVNKMQGKIKMIHTVNDPRCPLEQAEMFVEKLKSLGKKEGLDYEYKVIENFGHWSIDKEFRKKYLQEHMDYLNKIMKQ